MHTHTDHPTPLAAPAPPAPELLAALVEHHETATLPRLRMLWGYYRNPMSGGADPCRPAGGRAYRLAQERGLPHRITGAHRPHAADHDDRATGPWARKEVVVENDIAWRVHTMVDFMFGRPLVLTSTARDPALRRRIERALDAVWEASGGAALLHDIGLLGHVYGHIDLLVRVAGLAEPAARPNAASRDEDDVLDLARAAVRIEPVEPPRGVPLTSPHDYRVFTAYAIRSEREEADTDSQPARVPLPAPPRFSRWLRPIRLGAPSAARERRRTVVTEVFAGSHRWLYEQPEPDAPLRLVEHGPAFPASASGAAAPPIVHIQNISQPFRYEGLSEVEPLVPLQDELNTRISDRASRVTLQSFKMFLAKGLDGFGNVPVGPGQVWTTDNPDASVEAFGGDGASPSEDAHIEQVREAMDKASGVPPLASGVVRAKIGNLTSENALRVTLMGLLSKTARKRVTYGRGIASASRLVLDALDAAGILRTDERDRGVRVDWPDPLPREESDLLAAALKKIELGVPRERVLGELGYAPTDPGVVWPPLSPRESRRAAAVRAPPLPVSLQASPRGRRPSPLEAGRKTEETKPSPPADAGTSPGGRGGTASSLLTHHSSLERPPMPTDTAPTPITGADTHSDPAPPPAPPDSLESRLAQVQAELAESRRILDKARRDRDVQRALHESGAIDVDAAAALLADTTADAPAAVADLRARKPHLFRAAAPAAPAVRPATSAMSAAPADPRPGLSRAAERAASTGDRGALMTYLRLRRAGA